MDSPAGSREPQPTSGSQPDEGPLPLAAPFWRSAAWRSTLLRASAAYWISIALVFAGNAVAARALGPLEYGAVVLALSTTGLIATFLDLTLEDGLVHHGSAAMHEQNFGQLRVLFTIGLAADLGLGLAILGLVSIAAPWLSSIVGGGELTSRLIMLGALVAFTATLDGTTGAALTLVGQHARRMQAMALGSGVRLAFIAVAASRGPSAVLVAMAAGQVAGSLLQGVVAWRLAWSGWQGGERTSSDWHLVRGLLRKLLVFGVHTSVATSVQAAHSQLVPILIGRSTGARSVGLYDVATIPVTIGGVATGPARLAMLSENARAWAAGERGLVRRSLSLYVVVVLAVGVVGAAAGWFLLPTLIETVYSSRFNGAVAPARILLIAAVAQLVSSGSKWFPSAIGRPSLRTGITVVELVLTVTVVALVAPSGLRAVATGVGAVAVVIAGLWFLVSLRVLRDDDEIDADRHRSVFSRFVLQRLGRRAR